MNEVLQSVAAGRESAKAVTGRNIQRGCGRYWTHPDSSGVTIRIEATNDDAFWIELRLSKDELADMLLKVAEHHR